MIRYRYGAADPLKIPAHDLLMKHLRHRGKNIRRQELRQHTLRTSINLIVNNEIAANLRNRGEAVGMFLHAIHKEEMFQHVTIKVAMGEEALASTKAFLEERNISEDDYALDSAARLFRRWGKEFKKDRVTKRGESVRYLLRDLLKVRLSIQQAASVATRLQELINAGVVSIDRRMDTAIRSFILYSFTGETYAKVAEVQGGRHRNHVCCSCRRGREYLQYDERLLYWLSYCISTVTAKPVPVAS